MVYNVWQCWIMMFILAMVPTTFSKKTIQLFLPPPICIRSIYASIPTSIISRSVPIILSSLFPLNSSIWFSKFTIYSLSVFDSLQQFSMTVSKIGILSSLSSKTLISPFRIKISSFASESSSFVDSRFLFKVTMFILANSRLSA